MFPEPNRVALDWLFDRINLDPKIQIKHIDTKNQLADILTKGRSHVMNGIIFCVSSTSVISVPPIVLKWCRKERKKMRVKKESQKNLSWWWIWSRDAASGILMCYLLLHQKARERPYLKVKYLWVRGMSSNQDRGDLWWAPAHQTTQYGILTKSGLLKSVNLMKCWEQERADPWVGNHQVRSPSTQTSLSLMTMIWTLTPPQNQTFR